MSTKSPPTASPPRLRAADAHDPWFRATAERALEKFESDGRVCSRCFARVRRPHEAFADEIRRQGALGYYDETALLTVTATSSPDPATFSEVVPETTIADDRPSLIDGATPIEALRWLLDPPGDHKPSRPCTICECGTIDRIDDTRSRALMHRCVDNLAERLADLGGLSDLSHDHAHALVDAAYDNRLTGQDHDVLVRALVVGLEHA